MTDTPKPLVPLYPYQCPECGGSGDFWAEIAIPGGMIFPKHTDCRKCKGSGIAWLPTPHPAPDIQEIVEKAVRSMVKELFVIPYNKYTYDTMPDGSVIAVPANPDNPYSNGGG